MRKLKQLTFLSLLFIITVAFNFQDNPPSNWYQQFLSIPGSQQINDMTFLDSLTGFIVTSRNVNPDTATIFKTTNGGDNWSVVYSQSNRRLSRVKFINNNTGFVSGGTGTGTPHLYKTTNQGINWNLIPVTTGNAFWEDMSVLNEDTIWCVDKNSLNGGVYRTTNGGGSWQVQYSAGSQNPTRIYFVNGKTGFISDETSINKVRMTTNSGINWSVTLDSISIKGIGFVDSLTGWISFSEKVYKTTNGGVNWITQYIPSGSNFIFPSIVNMSVLNKDTIFGGGGSYNYGGGQFRGVVYRTTNGGTNWQYQIPDSSFHIAGGYYHLEFTDAKKGWAYTNNRGIHTTLGGDTSFLTEVKQVSTEIPKQYSLFQNYPNPFNPITIISFEIQRQSFVSLKVYDIQGREIANLLNQNKNAGKYNVGFDANLYYLTSGIYFYRIEVSNSKENFTQTKKMIYLA